jgi:hypothetical protein
MDRGELISEEERIEILNWICLRAINPKYHIFGNRLNIELNANDLSECPTIATVRQRLIQKEGLQDYIQERKFKDFVGGIFKGGKIHAHTDPNAGNLIHTRFNLILQTSDDPNYKTYYGGYPIKEKERHYVCCRSGLDYHWSEINHSATPRLALSFGFFIPRDELDNIAPPLPLTFEVRKRMIFKYIHLLFLFIYETFQTGFEWLYLIVETIGFLTNSNSGTDSIWTEESLLHQKREMKS